MAGGARSGLKRLAFSHCMKDLEGLNGLGSPLGIETLEHLKGAERAEAAKWPVEPVRDCNHLRKCIVLRLLARLNGLRSPCGIETARIQKRKITLRKG